MAGAAGGFISTGPGGATTPGPTLVAAALALPAGDADPEGPTAELVGAAEGDAGVWEGGSTPAPPPQAATTASAMHAARSKWGLLMLELSEFPAGREKRKLLVGLAK